MAEHDPNPPTLFDLAAPTTPFMDLEDPEYAYMFGFLQADGHLSHGAGQKGRLAVEINARDAHILGEFQRLTPYYSSITHRVRDTNFAEQHHSATWSLFALEARTIVNELGIPYGKKSRTIKPPRVEFSRADYIRGLIDADGSLGWTAQGLPFLSFTSASTAVAVYLCHYAKKVTGAERIARRNTRDQVYVTTYHKEQAQQLAEHLYYPGCLALDHKKANAAAIQTWVRPAHMRFAPPRRRWTEADDRELLRLGDPAAAATALDRTEQSCAMRLWRLRTGQASKPVSRPAVSHAVSP
ncbi:LAGLIDADG family homing endonuclease [Streptomyces sp. NPDC094032]|uniref:LAGLIDADG family homing endonuclease n=1 Tax=Streptomyces sp. NPDC094032 TaxID=3155308 RepID=UPI003318C36C